MTRASYGTVRMEEKEQSIAGTDEKEESTGVQDISEEGHYEYEQKETERQMTNEPQKDEEIATVISMIPSEKRLSISERIRVYILRNMLSYSFFSLLLLALGPLLFFGSFSSTQSLMTTLNKSTGYFSIALLYGVFAFCNFVAPSIEHALGPKIILVVMSSGYVIFVIAAGFSNVVVILISSAYLGFAAGLWWVAHGDYLNRISNSTNRGLYSGIFFAIFSLNGSLGNLFTGVLKLVQLPYFWIFMILGAIGAFGNALLLLLKPVSNKTQGKMVETDPVNMRSQSYDHLDEAINESELQGVMELDKKPIEVVPQPLGIRVKKRIKDEIVQGFKHVLGTLQMLFATPVMLMFHATSLYSGYSLTFFNANIPPLFGNDNLVPWVMMGFSFASGISAFILGFLSDKIGKRYCMFATFIIHAIALGLTAILHIFPPYSFFMIMVVCGCADACLNTMIYALLGTYFEGSRAAYAFAAFKFVQSISASASALGGAFIDGKEKFWIIQVIMGSLWIIAFVSYTFLECIMQPVDKRHTFCKKTDKKSTQLAQT